MPIELNVISLGLLVLAVVVAAAAGGLVGRRIRDWRERRAARARLGAAAIASGRAREAQPTASAPATAEPVAPTVGIPPPHQP
jgi:hypothetical protein